MYFSLARRMVTALQHVPLINDIVIVTSSAEVEMFAGHLGVRVMHQTRDEGINVSLKLAFAAFATAETTTALVIAGDLPLVTTEALTELVQSSQPQVRGVTIVPDRRHVGTNALVCTPADVIRTRFGPNSFAEHLRTAQEHGLAARIFECGVLALDIDEPEDLDAWRGYETDAAASSISVRAGRQACPESPAGR
jgi:2-phospho-L-lactate guanylyltransferase